MRDNTPRTVEQYCKWLAEEHHVSDLVHQRTYFESVATKVLTDFEKSQVWLELQRRLPDISGEYYLMAEYQLLIGPYELPPLVRKPFDSFLLKTFRKNILENRLWPEPPAGGWILPSNWFSMINDIVRTCFVVKYLDGVRFLTTKIQSLCEEQGLPCEAEYQAREEGYYAAHLYILREFEIPALTWDTVKVKVAIEVQITTQIQDLIKNLLHKHYESRRTKAVPDEMKWQWDYKSKEFATNYLGHILHYVEGMIMDVREGRNGRKAT